LPEAHWKTIGREIYLSLRTPFRKIAVPLAQELRSIVRNMMENSESDLKEIKRRLQLHLQNKLAEDEADVSTRAVSSIYPCLDEKHPDFNYGDVLALFIQDLLNDVNDKDRLNSMSKELIPTLVKADIIKPYEENKLTAYGKLIVTKLFLENEIRYHTALLNKNKGDFSIQDKNESKNSGRGRISSSFFENLFNDACHAATAQGNDSTIVAGNHSEIANILEQHEEMCGREESIALKKLTSDHIFQITMDSKSITEIDEKALKLYRETAENTEIEPNSENIQELNNTNDLPILEKIKDKLEQLPSVIHSEVFSAVKTNSINNKNIEQTEKNY
jgi:hypothetical protein